MIEPGHPLDDYGVNDSPVNNCHRRAERLAHMTTTDIEDQRRGIWRQKLDKNGCPVFDEGGKPVLEWHQTTRQLRRNALRELVGHCTRNGAMVEASGLSRAERRRRGREIWRQGQRGQGR